jgi:hypothetical protein
MLNIEFIADYREALKALNASPAQVDKGVKKGLTIVAKGIHNNAKVFLSGKSKPRGAYPVPKVTGDLQQVFLGFVLPGKSTTSGGVTFNAQKNEVIVFNSADYANLIHEGKETSAKYGPRRFLTDAFELFNRDTPVTEIIINEINKEMNL